MTIPSKAAVELAKLCHTEVLRELNLAHRANVGPFEGELEQKFAILIDEAVKGLVEEASRFVGFMAMLEASRELNEEPSLTGTEIVTSFMGNGASDTLRVADFRSLREQRDSWLPEKSK